MDLLQSGAETERRPVGPRLRALLLRRPPTWAVAVLAVLLLMTGSGGALTASALRQEQARQQARIDLAVRAGAGFSSTVEGVARGELGLLLVNRRGQRVQLLELEVAVEGLRVERIDPQLPASLGGFEQRAVRITFVVTDCRRLVLPGRIRVTVRGEGKSQRDSEIAVRDPAVGAVATEEVSFGACPPSARAEVPGAATDVGARPAGGRSQRVGAGAEGVARLEIRNGGAPVRLLELTGDVPGVEFGTLRLEGGRSLVTDGLVIVRLPFRIEDCSKLEKAGQLVLSVERSGAVQQIALQALAEPQPQLGSQVTLPVVYDACG